MTTRARENADGARLDAPLASPTFTGAVSHSDANITNVGDISLDTISSDAGTSIGVTLGTDAGDDFNVGSGKLVVEGDTGKVGIGDATPPFKLSVRHDSSSEPSIQAYGGSPATNNNAAQAADANGFLRLGNEGAYHGQLVFNGRGSTQLELKNTYSGGSVSIVGGSGGMKLDNGATSWTSNSDERYKDIIENITDGLTKVNKLRAVIGKHDYDADGIRRPFLMAQDFIDNFDDAIDVPLNEEGEEDIEGGKYSLRYSDVIPLLVVAIKELSAKNDALEARILTLESA
jgi:hypothetical protein